MEGSLFYFIFWAFWICLTFFIKKENPYRFKLSAAVLIIIILADVPFSIEKIQLNAGGLSLLLMVYMALRKESGKTLVYFYISSFIITIAYATFCLFEIFDPVWIIFKKEWMMGMILGYLSILLQKDLRGRLQVLISGSMQGDILYAYILSKHGFPYKIGAYAYLDAFALTAALLIAWTGIENMGMYFEQTFHVYSKGKQKSS